MKYMRGVWKRSPRQEESMGCLFFLGMGYLIGICSVVAFALHVNEVKVAEERKRKETNGDRIRGMNDEELAVTIGCPNETGHAEILCDHSDSCNCCECCLKWLKQEVEKNE